MRIHRNRFILLLVACLVVIPLSGFAATETQHGIEVTITLSSDAAVIGEDISASYSVSGGSGTFSRIYGVWNVHDDKTKCTYQLGGGRYDEASGSSSYIPRFGNKLYFQLEGQDSNGTPFLLHSEEIPVSGEVNYPTVDIRLSSEVAAIGEELTANFEVTGGSGVYPRILGVWNIHDSRINCTYQLNNSQFKEPTGTSSYTPKFGDKLFYQLEGQDSYGVPFLVHSKEIEISGDAVYPEVSIKLSSDSAYIGRELTAEFEITGGTGTYTSIYGVWNLYDKETNCTYQLDSKKYTETSGTASFIPTYGNKLYFQIEGKDSEGVPFLAHSAEIPINAEDPEVIRIPESTKEIESKAFVGIKAKTIYIPKSVTTIADDAFDPDVLLVFEDDTLVDWANSVGIKYRIGTGR